ncbi:MAG: murein hydrolase activator EnvC family protein [bacterium]
MIVFFIFLILTTQISEDFYLQTLREKLIEIEQRREQMTEQSIEIGQKLDLLIEHRQLTKALLDSLRVRRELLERDSARIYEAYHHINSRSSVYDSLLSDKLRQLYKYGNPSALEVFLSEETFSDFVNRIEYLSRTTDEVSRIVSSTSDLRFNLRRKIDSLNAMIQRLDQLKQEISIEQQEILRDSVEYIDLLAKLDSSISAQELLREEINEAAQEIHRQIQAHERSTILSSHNNGSSSPPSTTMVSVGENSNHQIEIIDSSTNQTINPQGIDPSHYFEQNKGNIPRPLSGEVIETFQPARGVLGNGIDIAAEVGSSVRSVASGVVYYTQRFVGLGNVVMIDHGNSYVTLYGYLSSPLSVEPGQQVTAGQTVGTVGEHPLGLSSRLHFEIRIHMKPVNPLEYLQ